MRDADSRLLAPTVDLKPDVLRVFDIQSPSEPGIEPACASTLEGRQRLSTKIDSTSTPRAIAPVARLPGEIVVDVQ